MRRKRLPNASAGGSVPDPIRHVAGLLLNFRPLQAAGACELIRDDAYEFLQRTADTSAGVLARPEHEVGDLRRFAFVPTPLRNRYGS